MPLPAPTAPKTRLAPYRRFLSTLPPSFSLCRQGERRNAPIGRSITPWVTHHPRRGTVTIYSTTRDADGRPVYDCAKCHRQFDEETLEQHRGQRHSLD